MLKNEKGGSLIEFVLIAPLLLVILFGIIEFGVLLYDKAMLTNACREGARAGIVFSDPRVSDSEIERVVRRYADIHLISFGSGSSLDVPQPLRECNIAGCSLTVTATYDFRFLVLSNVIALIGGNIQDIINLNAISVMRLE